MKPSEHLLDLGHPVAYYPGLVKHLGSVNAVLFFSQIFYWQDKATSDMGVYKTAEEIEAETGMGYREQATARKQLVERRVLIETHKRFEHRIYYRIDVDRLNEILQLANCGKRNSGDAESAVRGEAKAQIVNKAETTTKTTSHSRVIDEQFEEAWRLYPKRDGGNPKADALKQWRARLTAGADPQDMLAGVKRYAAHCAAKGKTGTEFVMQACRFFGKSAHYAEQWEQVTRADNASNDPSVRRLAW